MMIRIDKFDRGLAELQEFAKREYVLEVTGKNDVGRVKVGSEEFESAAQFHEWAAALTQADFNKIFNHFIEFLDRGAVSLE